MGQTWHEMKKLEKWGTFVALVTHDRSENLLWKKKFVFWQTFDVTWPLPENWYGMAQGKICLQPVDAFFFVKS